MKHLDDLYFWIAEREHIRNRKELGLPRPWTTDPILHEYRFCNVHRDDDTVTRWIHDNWLYPHMFDSNVQYAMIIARMVNHPDTLHELGYPMAWDPDHFMRVLSSRKSMGHKVWTTAYMITGGYSKGGESKEVIIARVLTAAFDKLLKDPIVRGDTLAKAAVKIRSPGIGTFLVGQAIADIKHSDLLIGADDWETWCAVGPGSTAGLNYLHDRPVATSLSDKQFQDEVLAIRELIFSEVGRDIDAQNVQNCLCEFSKYVRTKYYGGAPKSRYTPAKAAELLPPQPSR